MDGSRGGVEAHLGGVVVLARADVLFEQCCGAFEFDLGVVALDVRALQIGLECSERCARRVDGVLGRGKRRDLILNFGLLGPERRFLNRSQTLLLRGIDAEQRRALLDHVAFFDKDVRDATCNFRLQANELDRTDLAVGCHFGFERGAALDLRRSNLRQFTAPRDADAYNDADHHDGARPDNYLLFSGQSHVCTRCLPPKDEKSPLFRICYVESLILMETLQPTPLYAALFISVSISCDKI